MLKESVSVPLRPSIYQFARWALFIGIVLVALYFGARLAMHFFPFPICGFRWLTGLPCPFCGGTRCVVFFVSGHWIKAFLMNPLVFLACVYFLFHALFKAITRRSLPLFAGWKPSMGIVITLVLAHWGYLILASTRGWV